MLMSFQAQQMKDKGAEKHNRERWELEGEAPPTLLVASPVLGLLHPTLPCCYNVPCTPVSSIHHDFPRQGPSLILFIPESSAQGLALSQYLLRLE